jgi:alanine racemase
LTGPRMRLDLDAVRHNVAWWRERLAGREIWPVVKSNAYGLGAVVVANACLEAGADRLAVFDVEEARPLRSAGISVPIVQVSTTANDALTDALRLEVTPTIEDEAGARALASIAEWRGIRCAAQIAVDTGSGWSGVPAGRAGQLASILCRLPGVAWEGAWTHIAGKDSLDAQMRSFAVAVAAMRAEGLALPVLHAASTGPALWGKTTGAARIGIGLYGSAWGDADAGAGLRTAIEVEATVIAVKHFDVATPLGYDGRDVAQPGDIIATLRIGYADGLAKTIADGGGSFTMGGERCAIAGSIGMNCTMVRVPQGVSIRPGDRAVVIGDADGVRIDDAARAAGTIPHVLVTSLARGMPIDISGAGR